MADLIGYLLTIPGFLSAGYLLWKRFRKDVKIFPLFATYEIIDTEHELFKDINVKIKIGFLNSGEQSVAVTDLIGIMRYDKEIYEKKIESIRDVPSIPTSYSLRPNDFENVVNININPHESITKTFEFTFPSLIWSYLIRMGAAHFTGFFHGTKTELWTVLEKELKENWSINPIQFLFVVHIDSKKFLHAYIPLFLPEYALKGVWGTIDIADIERMKIQYFEKNKVNFKRL